MNYNDACKKFSTRWRINSLFTELTETTHTMHQSRAHFTKKLKFLGVVFCSCSKHHALTQTGGRSPGLVYYRGGCSYVIRSVIKGLMRTSLKVFYYSLCHIGKISFFDFFSKSVKFEKKFIGNFFYLFFIATKSFP